MTNSAPYQQQNQHGNGLTSQFVQDCLRSNEAGDGALAQAISLAKSAGTTFVVITHRSSVLGVADKMLLLRDGTQQAFGPRDEVLAALNKASQQAGQGGRTGPAQGGLAGAQIVRPDGPSNSGLQGVPGAQTSQKGSK